jgi:hypothetical protein
MVRMITRNDPNITVYEDSFINANLTVSLDTLYMPKILVEILENGYNNYK